MAPNVPTPQLFTAPIQAAGMFTAPAPEQLVSRTLVEVSRRGGHRFLTVGPIMVGTGPAVVDQRIASCDFAGLTRKGRRDGWRSWWAELALRGRYVGIYR